MMNPDVKSKWVTALRSGEYVQGTGFLCPLSQPGKTHCCLGVLAEVAVSEKIIDPPDLEVDAFSFDGDVAELGDNIQDWAGLSSGNPAVRCRGTLTALSVLNDDMFLNFDEIADLIETYL